MIAWVDGTWMELDVRGGPSALLALLDGRTGPGVFETMGAVDGRLPLWDRHIARIRRGARRLDIAWRFDEPAMRRAAHEVLRRNGEQNGVLRMTLVPMAPATSRWLIVARRRIGADRPLRLVVIDDLDRPHGPPRDLKCTARDLYDRALARAAADGADDAVFVDGADRSVLETAVGNLVFWSGDRWVTPEADGRLLPGVARAVLIDALAAGPMPVEVRRCSLDELAASPAVAVTNAVHGPRPAILLGGGPSGAAVGEAGAAEAEARLASLAAVWREQLGGP